MLFLAVSDGPARAPVDADTMRRLRSTLPPPAWDAFLEAFLTEGDRHVRRMEDAWHEGDAEAVGLAAHALKPTSGLLGAGGLSEACRRLEEESFGGGDLGSGVAGVRRRFDEVRRHLGASPQAAAMKAREAVEEPR